MCKRILIITSSLARGGADRQIVYLTREFTRVGHDVYVAPLTPPGPMAELATANGAYVSFPKIGPISTGSTIRNIFTLTRQIQPHTVLGFMYHGALIARLTKLMHPSAKIICCIRNENLGGAWRSLFLRATDFFSDAVTTNTIKAARKLSRSPRITKKSIETIPNIFDPADWSSKDDDRSAVMFRNVQKRKTPQFRWFTAARLRAHKGIFDIVRAAEILLEKGHEDFEIRVAGDGPEKRSLEEKIFFSPARDFIILIGPTENIANHYLASDGFVLASHWEGFPNVILEAVYYRLSIVTTQVGGIEETFCHQKDLFFVPPENPFRLASEMSRVMLLSRQKREEMNQEAFKKLDREHCPSAVAGKWLALIDRVARIP